MAPNEMQPLSIENLRGGLACTAVNAALEAICRDLVERPNVDGVRRVDLTIKIKPDIDRENLDKPVVRILLDRFKKRIKPIELDVRWLSPRINLVSHPSPPSCRMSNLI